MRCSKSYASVISDMVKVLKYLSNPLNRQEYDHMAQRTGVPAVQIRRFIEPECMEKRELTRRHLRVYAPLLKTSTTKKNEHNMMCGALKKQVIHLKEGTVDINMSKWDAFLSVAEEYGYIVKRASDDEMKETGKKVFVARKPPENTTVYFSSFHVNYDDIETYEWRYCPIDGWINDYEFIREKCPERNLCPHCGRHLIIGNSSETTVQYYEL